MFSKNLKHYRLLCNLSMEELAARAHVSANAIKKYEHGEMMPSSQSLTALAQALDVKTTALMQSWASGLTIQPGPYRGRKSARTQRSVEAVLAAVEIELGKFWTVLSMLPADRLPVPVDFPRVPVSTDDEIEFAAAAVRRHLAVPETGPFPDMVVILENLGYLVIRIRLAPDWFDAQYGHVNGRPYIALAEDRPPDRQRHSLAHEIAHICLNPMGLDEEKAAAHFAGALLLPRADMERELYRSRRHGIALDELRILQREYKVSMKSLVKRARVLGIVSEQAEVMTYRRLNGLGLAKDENADFPRETPSVYQQLVVQLTMDQELSISRGAELLGVSLPAMSGLLYGAACP